MGRRLYVGNLPYSTTDQDLTTLFSQVGTVENVRVMRDMATGRARGFGFVQMATDAEAEKAISEFHEFQMQGRPLIVNEAKPKPEFAAGAGRGFGRGGGGDYGGGGGGEFGGGGGGGRGSREPRW
jgi:RNA recognition motif-containing protein